LREANVDLERGTVRINKSRDEGEESLPKTRASRRTIVLYPNVVEVLRTVRPKPLHSTPESYFFTVPDGRPIFTRDWPRDFRFYDVLTRLKIRQRKFYCTRHTSISWQLTTGANPWGVAKYHGTSMAMIDAHYGKWIPEKGLDQAVLRALAGGENGDLSGDLSAAAKVIAANSSSYECEEGDLNPTFLASNRQRRKLGAAGPGGAALLSTDAPLHGGGWSAWFVSYVA
jgi:hypothetical protein